MTTTRQILEFIHEELELSINRDEVIALQKHLYRDNDFHIDIDGNEYRFINADVIWETYSEAIRDITEDCYEINAPDWLAIDWEKTAENCFVDGYGHTFSSYDGSELECEFEEENYFIFRTN